MESAIPFISKNQKGSTTKRVMLWKFWPSIMKPCTICTLRRIYFPWCSIWDLEWYWIWDFTSISFCKLVRNPLAAAAAAWCPSSERNTQFLYPSPVGVRQIGDSINSAHHSLRLLLSKLKNYSTNTIQSYSGQIEPDDFLSGSYDLLLQILP